MDASSTINHKNLNELLQAFNKQHENLWLTAINSVNTALTALYGVREISLQQLSATFRRGDLLDDLLTIYKKIRNNAS